MKSINRWQNTLCGGPGEREKLPCSQTMWRFWPQAMHIGYEEEGQQHLLYTFECINDATICIVMILMVIAGWWLRWDSGCERSISTWRPQQWWEALHRSTPAKVLKGTVMWESSGVATATDYLWFEAGSYGILEGTSYGICFHEVWEE